MRALMIVCAFLVGLVGCKSYTVDIKPDGTRTIKLVNVGFDTKIEAGSYKHGDTELTLQGYQGESGKAIELLAEIVKRLPVPVVPVK